ncbi:extensin, proline-rich protein [Dorcoceras hygrometricum]|uniref:Extensin, proline-rich protein n=1 Tax=Dorcoceras hygrometricum TaxID=472368 RepID=A0A2Z7BV97_9LAMI|nr:extensin, proline-rich protein [Dorcoceras hygrometricum]
MNITFSINPSVLQVSSEWEGDLLSQSGAPGPALSPIPTASPPPPPLLTAPPPPPSVFGSPPTPPVMAPTPPPVKPPRTTSDCIPLCMVRCKYHSRKNICMRTCLTCCNRCKCVPPGQFGNKEKCGKCYTDMTTRGGKLKCP